MTTMTLTGFLLARIAEDEEVARDAHYEGQRWVSEEEAVVAADRDLDPLLYLDRKRDAYHAQRWSPARVLAECDAKRRIVGEFKQVHADYHASYSPTLEGQRYGLMKAVVLLALPYADHPDFREEWAL